MNQKELNQLVKECKAELNQLGLELPTPLAIRLSTRMTRAFGNCAQRGRFVLGQRVITSTTISISVDLPTDVGRDTVMHELLHAVAGCEQGHGGEWLRLARIVNKAFGYKITQYATGERAEVVKQIRSEKSSGYTVTCENCGRSSQVTARHGIVKNPHGYSCKCGRKAFKITRNG